MSIQVSSQLMEAVQKKVILSQKKEEIEMIMNMVLQDQLDSAAHSQSETTSANNCGKESLSSKLSRPFRALFGR